MPAVDVTQCWWQRLVTRLERFHGARRAKTVRIGAVYRASAIDIPGRRPAYLDRVERATRSLDNVLAWHATPLCWCFLRLATGLVVGAAAMRLCGFQHAR
jgi:hypothetical protein